VLAWAIGYEWQMSEQPPKLPDSLKEALGRSASEHLVNVVKAAFATLPFGGGIASLMTDYIPSRKHARLEEFANQVANDLKKLRERVDEQALLTDEFAYVFEKCFRGAAENHQAEKLEAFRGILVNSAIGINILDDERDYFLGLANTLSTLHLRILSFMNDPQKYLHAHGISADRIRGGFAQFMPVAMPGIELEIIKGAFGDLHQAGLINTDRSIFSTMTSAQGLHLLGDRVSDLGKRFAEFCKSPVS
jgi:hypothetical protein